MRRSTRRELIGAAAAGAAFAAVPPAWAKQLLSTRAAVGRGTFDNGVASGEPSASGVTFWSKLSTSRPTSGARLIVARDQDMRHTVATAVVPTGRSIDGTLKTRIGGLKPHSRYYYVWESGDDVSPVGRTQTLVPATSSQPQLLAISSCQNYTNGYFRAHADSAAQDLDLCVFLGDYIYEVKRGVTANDVRADPIDSNDLRSYRAKYRLYRADDGLRELHRVQPVVHIWDDHEVANNYTDNRPAPSPLQRAAAYRASFEWLPRMAFPSERFRIFKRMTLGTTVDLFLLDERQYRTVDANNVGVQILGERQMQWLIDGLKASRAKWKIIANQVVVAPTNYGGGAEVTDAWGGYPESRTRLLGEIERSAIPNVVFYSGDAHVFMQNLLASDFEAFRSDPSHPPAAVEYVGGSVTSLAEDHVESEVQAANPWIRMFNGTNHGYALVSAGADLVTEYRRSEIGNPVGVTTPFERFTQPSGTNTPSRESLPPPT
ncbi:MAG: alkaline phosphatase [Thermoleophilaceae bacterium]|jgi:phosphodiesterase/alkaline phosphatase D-like protein|nr:alkaline phosphatase [Thermoleophilaceae bacterium]MEA2471918.1 alkaline phosphatase [Thermoleophilaceae bacterium]